PVDMDIGLGAWIAREAVRSEAVRSPEAPTRAEAVDSILTQAIEFLARVALDRVNKLPDAGDIDLGYQGRPVNQVGGNLDGVADAGFSDHVERQIASNP